MRHLFIVLCLFFSFGIFTVRAQPLLTLEEAVRTALENNYDIKLFSNNLQIDKNNVTLGNAGFLPVAGASLSNNNSVLTSRQEQSNGQIREASNAKNSNLNYGIGLDWVIFDGFGMFARYDQLQEFQKLGEENLKFTILSRVAEVLTLYYDLVQQQQQLEAYDTTMDISRLRVETAKNRFEIGKAAKLEVLNAQVDFNTDTTNYMRQAELYYNTRIRLNEILARDVNTLFSVKDSIVIDDKLVLSQLAAQAQEQNPSLQAALINKRIAELELKQVRANRYPTVALNSGYNFTNAQSALGFATRSTGRGFNYGLTASVNVFNGFNQRRNEKNASLLIGNSELEYQKMNQNIQAQLASAYQTYLTNLALVGMEENNRKIASQNLDITMEKFRLGSISPVEFRDAQLNFINATSRFTNAQYEAKLAEIFLKQLTGTISIQ